MTIKVIFPSLPAEFVHPFFHLFNREFTGPEQQAPDYAFDHNLDSYIHVS